MSRLLRPCATSRSTSASRAVRPKGKPTAGPAAAGAGERGRGTKRLQQGAGLDQGDRRLGAVPGGDVQVGQGQQRQGALEGSGARRGQRQSFGQPRGGLVVLSDRSGQFTEEAVGGEEDKRLARIAVPTPAPSTADGGQHVFVPFYATPTDPNWATDWARMIAAAPGQSVAVLDIGIDADAKVPNEVAGGQVRRAQATVLRVLGYVPTNWGAGPPVNGHGRTPGDIKGYIDQWYGYGVDGIYFDEADQWPTTQSFYRVLRDHVQS